MMLTPDDVQSTIDKVTKERDRHPVAHIRVTAQRSGLPFTGDVWIAWKQFRARCRFKAPTLDYEVGQDGFKFTEIVYATSKYDQNVGDVKGWYLMSSRMSDIGAMTFPTILLVDLSAYVRNAKLTSVAAGNQIDWTVDTERGPLVCQITVSKDGKIVAYQEGGTAEHPARRWAMEYTEVASAPPDSFWIPRIPDGFAPFALQDLRLPLEPGTAFPLAGWTDATTRRPVDLVARFRGKAGIFAVFGDDPMSRLAMKALHTLAGEGVPIAVTAVPGAAVGPGWVLDATGKRLGQLSPQATPTFFIINPKGELHVTMVGFDRQHPDAFLKEARERLKDAK